MSCNGCPVVCKQLNRAAIYEDGKVCMSSDGVSPAVKVAVRTEAVNPIKASWRVFVLLVMVFICSRFNQF